MVICFPFKSTREYYGFLWGFIIIILLYLIYFFGTEKTIKFTLLHIHVCLSKRKRNHIDFRNPLFVCFLCLKLKFKITLPY